LTDSTSKDWGVVRTGFGAVEPGADVHPDSALEHGVPLAFVQGMPSCSAGRKFVGRQDEAFSDELFGEWFVEVVTHLGSIALHHSQHVVEVLGHEGLVHVELQGQHELRLLVLVG